MLLKKHFNYILNCKTKMRHFFLVNSKNQPVPFGKLLALIIVDVLPKEKMIYNQNYNKYCQIKTQGRKRTLFLAFFFFISAFLRPISCIYPDFNDIKSSKSTISFTYETKATRAFQYLSKFANRPTTLSKLHRLCVLQT